MDREAKLALAKKRLQQFQTKKSSKKKLSDTSEVPLPPHSVTEMAPVEEPTPDVADTAELVPEREGIGPEGVEVRSSPIPFDFPTTSSHKKHADI